MEEFDAAIVAADRGGAYVAVPAAVVAALGGKGRIPVDATFDGIAYKGSIVSMGGDDKVLGLLKTIRTTLGKEPGDMVHVTVEVDDTKRTVHVADDVRRALTTGKVVDAFDALSYSHQREYVRWIDEAKKPGTRAKRITEMVERLR